MFKSNWAWANTIDEKTWAVKFNLHFKAGDVVDLTGGARYQDREVDYVHGRYLENGVNPYGIGGVGAGTPAGNCCTSAAIRHLALLPGSRLRDDPVFHAADQSQSAADLQQFRQRPDRREESDHGRHDRPCHLPQHGVEGQPGIPNNTETFFKDPLNSYEVKEKTTSAFVMGDAGDAAGVFHANFGVRVVRTQLTVDGAETNPNGSTFVGTASWNGVNANDVPFDNSRSYTDVLPSFNFVLNATDTQKLRFGAARVMSPQNLQQLGAGLQYGFTRAAPGECTGGASVCFKFDGGNAGNADLDPFRASQFNLSWEDYFARSGLVSVGYFYKAVDNFVTTANMPTSVADGTGGTTANVDHAGQWRHGQDLRPGTQRASTRSTLASGLRRTTRVRIPTSTQTSSFGGRFADPGRIQELRQRHRVLRARAASRPVRPTPGATWP